MSVYNEPLGKVSGFMFDVDGTLILSDRQLGKYEILPGAVDALKDLEARGIPFLALTNGSAYPAAEQAAKLRALGLPITDERMLTPNSVAASLFHARGISQVLVLGQESVCVALEQLRITALRPDHATPTEAEAVYVAWHPDCVMPHIHAACDAILAGAAHYTASDVPFFASKSGRAFGYSCAIAGAIARVTGIEPELTGKPSVQALAFVAAQLGVPMTEIAVIGDDPRVEIEMARSGGAIGIGVTSGTTSKAEWDAQPLARRPHRVIENLTGLANLALTH